MHAHTNQLPNLGAISTQRVEGLHPMIKSVTNRHTPMRKSVQKICDEVKEKQIEYETMINQQRINNPRLMDRFAFRHLTGKITYQAIDLVSRELDGAKKLAEEFNQRVYLGLTSPIELTGESCVYDRQLPLPFGLPCKCWLYSCVVDVIPIPISLIHPRWFFDGPPAVFWWRMTFDSALSLKTCLEKSSVCLHWPRGS